MYNQPETILEQYDLEIKQIVKGRGAYICDTDQGQKLLMPFRGSKERGAFLREVLQKLSRQGFAIEQICVTKEGEAVAVDESGTRYWLKDYVSGSECSTARESEMRGAVEQLADFHSRTRECELEIPAFMKSGRGQPTQVYRRHYRELIKVKNYVNSRKSRNAFEHLFQEQYPHYIENAKEAIELLEALEQQGWEIDSLCHGDFNQHNVLRTSEGMRMVHFETMCCNEPVVDLSNFVRKMMEKNNWDTHLGIGLLETYDRKRKLSGREWQLLYLTLLFPEKFWKISNHYSNSRKAWVSGRDIDKMNRMIGVEPSRERFLQNLFSFLGE